VWTIDDVSSATTTRFGKGFSERALVRPIVHLDGWQSDPFSQGLERDETEDNHVVNLVLQR
jgi:hypothetical protein